MDKFKYELKNDEEFRDLIWINYFKNRDFREAIASKKWNELYSGKTNFTTENELLGLNSLNRFSDFTKNNIEFSNKLIKRYFFLVKNKFDTVSNRSLDKKDKVIKNNTSLNNEDEYFKMWNQLNDEIEDEFSLEYEKMERISEIFKDVSLFSQVGWDLSKFTKEDMFVISKLNETLVNRAEITDLLDKIGKIEIEKKEKNNKSNKNIPQFHNEYMGIHLDNNLSKLLPSELSSLHNRLLKKLFYIRYAEKRLLNYSMNEENNDFNNTSDTKRDNGPVIICIDTSSSMSGLPEEIAKSIVLYILKKSLEQKKSLYLITFGSIDQLNEYNLTNKENGLFHALSFLKKGFYGGTDFLSPLKRSFEIIEQKQYQNSDILFITDGLGKIPKSFITELNKKKSDTRTKIFSILLNSDNSTLEFSDESINYKIKNNKEFKGEITIYDKIGHYEFLDKH